MESLSKKISVVVPVYNASKTIERCVDSILKQSYKYIEVILINDGSNDNSLEICNNLRNKDSRVIVLNIGNSGVSIARNKGIEMATGQYIAFVDSDDYIKPTMYEKLIKIAENDKLPLVFCNYEEFTKYEDRNPINQLSYLNKQDNFVNSIEVIQHMLKITNENIFGCCWRTLIDLDLLKSNKIRFEPGITMAEDLKFMLECLGTTSKVGICEEYLYCFFSTGTSTTSKYMPKQDQDMHFVNKWIRGFISELSTYEELQESCHICMANTLVVNAANVCKKFSPYNIFERVQYIRGKKKENNYTDSLKIAFFNKQKIMKKQWLQMSLLYFNLDILVIIYHSIKYKNFKKHVN